MNPLNRQLRILHVDPEKRWAGGETQVMGLVERLSSRRHENVLLCHPDGLLIEAARRMNVRTLPFKMRNDLDLRPVFGLKKLIEKEEFDIVHFHTKRAHGLALWLWRVRPGVRYVVTRRMDYPVKRSWYNDRLYNRRVDGVVAISAKIRDLLIEGGVQSEKIRVIYSGIDPRPFSLEIDKPRASSLPTVGTVAVLERRKGHRYLLEAAKILKDKGVRPRILLAGAGQERAFLEQLVTRWGLQREVVFMEFVSDVPNFLAGIDLFVLPSLNEGLGVSIIEAMAAGKPVVASRVGGIPELVQDRITGLLVPPGNAQALAEAISHLLSEPSMMESMGTMAKRRVQRDLTMDHMADQNETFYNELLQCQPVK